MTWLHNSTETGSASIEVLVAVSSRDRSDNDNYRSLSNPMSCLLLNVCTNLDSPARQRTEGRWWNAPFRRGLISRCDLQKHVFLARVGAEHKREWQPRIRDGGWLI